MGSLKNNKFIIIKNEDPHSASLKLSDTGENLFKILNKNNFFYYQVSLDDSNKKYFSIAEYHSAATSKEKSYTIRFIKASHPNNEHPIFHSDDFIKSLDFNFESKLNSKSIESMINKIIHKYELIRTLV